VLRVVYLSFYGGCAALGVAAVARPLTFWIRAVARSGLGALSSVPSGWAFALLGLAISSCTLALAIDVAIARRSSPSRHAVLLVLVAIAAALRINVEPLPATDALAPAPERPGPAPPPTRDPLFPDYPHRRDRADRDRIE
jgi:hypothetical protein